MSALIEVNLGASSVYDSLGGPIGGHPTDLV